MANSEFEPKDEASFDLINSVEQIVADRNDLLKAAEDNACLENMSSVLKTTPGDYYQDKTGGVRADLDEKIRLISQGKY